MLETNTIQGAAPATLGTAFTNGYEFAQGTGYTLPEYPFVAPPELATGEVKRHPIVIVGGGITGLTLACALADYGIKAVLLDEDNTVGVKGASSRGICYAQKTLEIFKRLGIYERIAAKGVQWSVGRTFAGADEVYAFDLRQQQTHSLSRQPPFINIQQFYVEGFLVEQIYQPAPENRLVDIRWSHRVTALEQTGDFATLQLETPAGNYTLQAEHVIDCSGSRSPFRAWCGATVTAQKGDDRWCIADVRFKNPPPVERHTWIEAPFNEGRAVWQHLMADGVWRIDYQMPPHANPEEVSREDVVRARLKAQFKSQAGQVLERCRLRDRLGRPLCLPQRMPGQPAPRPRVFCRRCGACDEPLRRARRQLGRAGRRQPGLEAGRRVAGPRCACTARQLSPRTA
jgi:3-(3-hydroxy-phenyl)propionate hydroxylase